MILEDLGKDLRKFKIRILILLAKISNLISLFKLPMEITIIQTNDMLHSNYILHPNVMHHSNYILAIYFFVSIISTLQMYSIYLFHRLSIYLFVY